jgi:uncharacterized membrane protein (DUF485 family)
MNYLKKYAKHFVRLIIYIVALVPLGISAFGEQGSRLMKIGFITATAGFVLAAIYLLRYLKKIERIAENSEENTHEQGGQA